MTVLTPALLRARICAGLHVADRSVFINSASILWAFDVAPAKDGAGKPIPLDLSPTAFDDAVTSEWCTLLLVAPRMLTMPSERLAAHPLPFEVDFKPRFSQQTINVIDALESFGA